VSTPAQERRRSPRRRSGRSFVDLEHGLFYRLPEGQRPTNKRQPPVPIPPRLLAHMRRWVAKGFVSDFFVEWSGQPVRSVKTGFKSAVRLANLPNAVTPHTLRHTAATRLMQAGVDKWEAAGFLGMSVEMLDRSTVIIILITCGRRRKRSVIGRGGNRWPKRWPAIAAADRSRLNPLKNLVGPGGLEPPTRPL
jgi:integrase